MVIMHQSPYSWNKFLTAKCLAEEFLDKLDAIDEYRNMSDCMT